MSSTNEVIKNETAVIAEGKKVKKTKKFNMKAEPEPEPEKGDLFATLLAEQQANNLINPPPVVEEDEDEKEERLAREALEAAKKGMDAIKAKKAEKAKKNLLPDLRAALIAKEQALFDKKVAEFNQKITDINSGLFDDKLLAKPEKTKSGKVKVPVKDGEPPRVESVMGQGSMRAAKLKSLFKANGEGVRWVKMSDGALYGIWKKEVCRRHEFEAETFEMPIWADIKKELGFEKGMTIELFKQQLTTE